jgi:hypothetical protein
MWAVQSQLGVNVTILLEDPQNDGNVIRPLACEEK